MKWLSPVAAENQVARIATLLAAGTGLLLLVLFGQLPGDSRWVSVLGNAAHGPASGLFALVVIGLLRQPHRQAAPVRNYLVAFGVTLSAGALVELLQLIIGRDAALGDLLRDALGALTGIALFTVVDPALRLLANGRAVRRAGLAVGGIGAAMLVAPLVATVWAYAGRDRNFPQLADFDSPVSTYFLATYSAVAVERHRIPADLAVNTGHSIGLQARVSIDERWGIALWEPCPDWREYQRLALDVANPTGATLLLRVRIRDQDQNGMRPAVDVGAIEVPARSRVTRRLPLRRQPTERDVSIDFRDIGGLVLHHHPANRASEFYVMRIWLE